jgi:Zn-dependent protease/predicted transcriptional regulator
MFHHRGAAMRWSFKIGRIAGIDLYIHFTFLLFLGWLAYIYYAPHRSVADAILGVAFVLAVFATVVLHELGHALTARRYGIETRDITLLPIGGVARLARIPEEPARELAVAVAGPLVNVAIAAILLPIILVSGGFTPVSKWTPNSVIPLGGSFIEGLFFVNLWLVAFNAIPAFPMDGGRVLRALLAMTMDYAQATNVAAMIGQGIAFLFAIVGLFGPNIFLLLIALFVWIGAAGEASVAQMRSAIAGIPVRRAMIREFATIAPTDDLRSVADRVMDGYQQDFPVVRDGKVAGILRLSDLMAGIQSGGLSATVEEHMQTNFDTTTPAEPLDRALSRLRANECPVMPVLDNGRLVGLLTPENVGELVMIRQAVRARRESGPQPAGVAAAQGVPETNENP